MAVIGIITRKFTAEFRGEEIVLSPKPYNTPHGPSTVWEAATIDGKVVGILQHGPCCDGWRFAHPEDGGALTLALGATVADLPERVYGVKDAVTADGEEGGVEKVTNVTEVTPPCDPWSYSQLVGAVRVFVRSKYSDGHVQIGEAWQQAVVMPQSMIGTEVSIMDLRRAMEECGWSSHGGSNWYRV